MAIEKHPPGSPMTLANMYEQGLHHLIAYCLNDACRHQALIDVWKFPLETSPTSTSRVSESMKS